MKKPYVIGVTGGIGCGKSTVSDAFATLGVPVIDTDKISRNLTSKGGEAIETIRKTFGENYLLLDGSLDRQLMRKTVFKNKQALNQLEAILHPLIRKTVHHELSQSTAPYILLVVPLLVEKSGYTEWLNRILVIDCDESIQIQRVMDRSGLNKTEVKHILHNQVSRETRLQFADDVLDNSTDLSTLLEKVLSLHQYYLSLAAASTNQ
ncbi:MAG: dephospho-CoA kinase [Proteobacteria bacterium]|nr:dephospho-CoA kinase [Pseudomonadota bacterium]